MKLKRKQFLKGLGCSLLGLVGVKAAGRPDRVPEATKRISGPKSDGVWFDEGPDYKPGDVVSKDGQSFSTSGGCRAEGGGLGHWIDEAPKAAGKSTLTEEGFCRILEKKYRKRFPMIFDLE